MFKLDVNFANEFPDFPDQLLRVTLLVAFGFLLQNFGR